jgi:hypothetical protein
MEGHTFSNTVRCTGVCKNRQEALFMASAEQNRFTYFLRRFKSLGMSRPERNIMKPLLFTALYPGNFYVWTKCIMFSPWLLFGLCSWKSQHRAKQHGMGQIRIRKHLNLALACPRIIIQFKQINQPDATVLQVYYLTFCVTQHVSGASTPTIRSWQLH